MEPPSKNKSDIFLAKLPNFLDVEPEPFDPLTYKGVEEEEARLKENVIRWRYKKDENNNYLPDQKESNARFIKWSDGSLSLLLGDEMFEVHLNEIDNHQYLIVHHSHEGVLQTQAQFTNTMSFQPYGIKSLTHRKLTASIAERHQRAIKTKVFTGEHSKEALRQEIKDNRRINQRIERLKKQKKPRPKNSEGRDGREEDNEKYGKSSRYHRYDDDEEEEEEEEEEEDSEGFIVDDDYDEEEEQREREKEERILKAKREGERQRRKEEERKERERQRELSRKRKFEEHADLFEDEGSNEEEEEEEEEDDNDEEEEEVTMKKKSKKRQVMMSDDEDED